MQGRVFSGVQPSGQLQLGNYLGAIKNWLNFQRDYECLFCIVDLHALTQPQDPFSLINSTREIAACYIAAGVDHKKHIIYNQSKVIEHAELGWILGCMTPLGWLNRMTQFKDKAGKKREQAGLGLYAYPTLQAADILLFKATHVPIGEDQKQHIELTRDIAGAFNRKYGNDFFKLPEPVITKTAARIMSLRDGKKKMSKSDESDYSRINLFDDADTIALKIRKAKTDSEPIGSSIEDMDNRPEAKNLVNIMAAVLDKSPDDICAQYAGQNFSSLKHDLTEAIVSVVVPIGNEAKKLMNDYDEIDIILNDGADKARAIAENTMKEIREIIGLLQ